MTSNFGAKGAQRSSLIIRYAGEVLHSIIENHVDEAGKGDVGAG